MFALYFTDISCKTAQVFCESLSTRHRCFFCGFDSARFFVIDFFWISRHSWMRSSRWKQYKEKRRSLSCRHGLTETLFIFSGSISKKRRYALGVCAENMCYLRSCVAITLFQCRSKTLINGHALGTWIRPVQKKKWTKIFLRRRQTFLAFCEGKGWWRHRFSTRVKPGVLKKQLVMSLSSTVQGRRYDANRWRSSSVCIRRSGRTQLGAFCLNRPIYM